MDIKSCRVCRTKTNLISIFKSQYGIKISQKIMAVTTVKISKRDKLPHWICLFCVERLKFCFDFKLECERSDTELRSKINIIETPVENNTMYSSDSDCTNLDVSCETASDSKASKVKNKSNKKQMEDASVNDKNKESQSVNDDDSTDLLKQDVKETSKKKRKKRTAQCFSCGKILSTCYLLKMHLRTHTGEKPFVCSYCNKAFSLPNSLKVHERVHTGEKPLKCETCGLRFSQTSGLAIHRRLHTGERPYKCTFCPAAFRTSSQKIYHVKKHLQDRSFVCEICSKGFYRNANLRDHMRTHTGERPFFCSVCGAGVSFTKKCHLTRHMGIYHANGIFKCEVCESIFKDSVELKVHKRSHNSNENL